MAPHCNIFNCCDFHFHTVTLSSHWLHSAPMPPLFSVMLSTPHYSINLQLLSLCPHAPTLFSQLQPHLPCSNFAPKVKRIVQWISCLFFDGVKLVYPIRTHVSIQLENDVHDTDSSCLLFRPACLLFKTKMDHTSSLCPTPLTSFISSSIHPYFLFHISTLLYVVLHPTPLTFQPNFCIFTPPHHTHTHTHTCACTHTSLQTSHFSPF